MLHARMDDTLSERVTEYVLGNLSEVEAAAFAEHLSACAVCRREVESYDPVVQGLLHLAGEVAPSAALKRRLLQRGALFVLLRSGDSPWRPMAVPGVRFRELFVEADGKHHTKIVQMEAGTSFPLHLHADAEECYVIEGDLRDGDIVMRAGDYSRFGAGSSHGPLGTEQGCLLLVRCSTADEILG